MPLSAWTQLGATQAGTASPQTITGLSPVGGSLVVVIAGVSGSATTAGAVTVSSDITGATWTTTQIGGSAAASERLVMAYSVMPASPGTARTITVTYAAATVTHARCAALYVTGQHASTPVVGIVSTGNLLTSPVSVNVSQAPTVDDYLCGAIGYRNDNAAPTSPSGTLVTLSPAGFSATPSAGIALESQTGTTSTAVSYATGGTTSNALIGFVVKAAAGGTPALPPIIVMAPRKAT